MSAGYRKAPLRPAMPGNAPFDVVALRYAVLAASTLSFARAAHASGIKQATLSRRIASLEDRLGFRLFNRSTRGALPTEAGLRYLDGARRILADLDRLHANGLAVGAGRNGKLGIGFSTSLAAGSMRSLFVDLFRHFPELRIVGLEGDRRRLTQALHARAIDFAVISGDLLDLGLERRTLWSERIVVALHSDHPLIDKGRVYWSDLRGERFILPAEDPGQDLANLVSARLSEPGFTPDVDVEEVGRDNLLHMIPTGRFISLTTDASLGRNDGGVVFKDVFELSGAVSSIRFSGYWCEDADTPVLDSLLRLIGERYPP